MPLPDTFLNALISVIREEGKAVFASQEDAEYFRKAFRKQPLESPPAATIKAPPPPAPLPPQALLTPLIKKAEPPAPQPLDRAPIERTPMELKPPVNLSSIRNLLSVIAPELAILDAIPNDEIAQKLSERWKTKNQTAPISILVYHEPPEQRQLLEQIAKAIDILIGPAKIVQAEAIEKEKQWEAFLSVADLKWVIVCDYTLWQLSHLMTFYKETPALGTRLLGNTPLFLLPDLSLYLKDALLKRSLWKALCQKCM